MREKHILGEGASGWGNGGETDCNWQRRVEGEAPRHQAGEGRGSGLGLVRPVDTPKAK